MKIDKDLAMEYGPCCLDKIQPDTKNYPSFHYEGDEELGIPEEGTMVVKYRQVMEQAMHRGDDEHYACTVEILKIVSAEGEVDERPAKTSTEAADALDAIREALENHAEREE